MLTRFQNAKWHLACKMIMDHSHVPDPEEAKNLNDWQQHIQNTSETSPLTATHSSSFLKASKPAWLELILWTWQKSLPLLSLLWISRKIPSTIQVFKTLPYIEEWLTSPESLILNSKQGTQHTVIKGKKNKISDRFFQNKRRYCKCSFERWAKTCSCPSLRLGGKPMTVWADTCTHETPWVCLPWQDAIVSVIWCNFW